MTDRSCDRLLLLAAIVVVAFACVMPDALSTRQPPRPRPDAAFTPPQRGLSIDGVVVRVIDGDTVQIETRAVYRIRLLDCWAPESRTTDAAERVRGIAAKSRLQQLAEGREARVFIPLGEAHEVGDVLTFGRVLGRVWLLDTDGRPGDVDLSAQMVAEGHATASKENP